MQILVGSCWMQCFIYSGVFIIMSQPIPLRAELNQSRMFQIEFLTLVMKKFHEYLYCTTFTAHTDNNPFKYVLMIAKVSLTNDNFDILYQS